MRSVIHAAVAAGLVLGVGLVGTKLARAAVAGDASGVSRGPSSAVDATHSPDARLRPRVPLSPDAPLRDPALEVGTLPNGLRYYIRVNRSPANRAELRLVVNAGSMQEDDDQRGMAHFLEHMAFNGTRHFPHQSLVDFVESVAGMRFGADLNAYTSFDETVYKLTVPTDSARLLTQGLTVLEDWASGGITIDSTEVVAERGVVLGEWRSRLTDTLSQRLQKHQLETLIGAHYASRIPIGDPALLERAQPAPIKRYYRDWYRPDLMAVVVVGDVDAVEMEREIQERFGAIAGPERPRSRLEPMLAASNEASGKGASANDASASKMSGSETSGNETLANKTSADDTFIDVLRDQVSPMVQLLWPRPHQPAEPRAAYRQALVEQLFLQHMERRFLQLGQQPSRPFVQAQVLRGRPTRPLDIVGVSLVAWPDSLERALGAATTELERVAQHGVPGPALERQKAALLRELEGEALDSASRPSALYAAEYVAHYLTGDALLLSAEQRLVLARELLPAITPQVIARAARVWRESAGRKVLIQFPQFAPVRPPTRASVLAILDSVATTRLEPESVRATSDAPLMARLPEPGKVVRETYHATAGVTEWTLSNGARVLLKPNPTNPDEVLFRAWSPGGFLMVPDSLFFSPGRMVARLMTEAAGFGARDRGALLDQLGTSGVRDFRVHIGYADEEISFGGSPRELESLFQMLYLQFAAPKLDTAALRAWQSVAKYQGAQYSILNQLDQIFARGDPRLLPVSTNLAELTTVEQAMAVYRDRFGDAGDFTFTIVGAVEPERVRPLVERYLASLPGSGARETPPPSTARPFVSRVRSRSPVFDIPKATQLLVFDGELASAEPAGYLQERERLDALTGVIDRRFRERFREQLGATYGVGVQFYTYPLLPREHYRLLIQFDMPPERLDELLNDVDSALDSLRSHGASAAELARVAGVQRRQLETQLQLNAYWMQAIGLYTRLGLPLERITRPYEAPVTSAELQEAAARYLPPDVFIQLVALPKDSTSYARGDSTGRQ